VDQGEAEAAANHQDRDPDQEFPALQAVGDQPDE
jgi:hypothetical protein